jgi:hypothetical protein
VDLAHEGHHVVLAQRVNVDVLDDDLGRDKYK